jgi:hypothetical protein
MPRSQRTVALASTDVVTVVVVGVGMPRHEQPAERSFVPNISNSAGVGIAVFLSLISRCRLRAGSRTVEVWVKVSVWKLVTVDTNVSVTDTVFTSVVISVTVAVNVSVDSCVLVCTTVSVASAVKRSVTSIVEESVCVSVAVDVKVSKTWLVMMLSTV